jgi:hypothetical protein
MANKKRPYKHLLKNLFHEQATEIIPLLWPDYEVKRVLDVEMPDLKSTPIEGPVSPLEEGLVGIALPGAKVVGAYKTEWIEHSGNFERAYRVYHPEKKRLIYLVIEIQCEPEDEELPRRLLCTFVRINRYADEDGEKDFNVVQDERKGTVSISGYYVEPVVLCPFPQGVPAPIRNVSLEFNFHTLGLWEKDAREFLNRQISAIYFLLPVMKNADAHLLGQAIEQLVQRFPDDPLELGRHLTGLNLLMHQSETMSEEEKVAAEKLLKPFTHLLIEDPCSDC